MSDAASGGLRREKKGAVRLDRVLALLPRLEEAAPLLDRLVARSVADPDHRWSAAGEVATLGARLLPPEEVSRAVRESVEEAAVRSEALFRAVGEALAAVAEERPGDAGRSLLDTAIRERERGRVRAWEAWALAAARLLAEQADTGPTVRALAESADAARAGGHGGTAEARYRSAFRMAVDSGLEQEAARAARGAGEIAMDRGRWMEAEGWFRRSLAALDRHRDRGGEGGPEWRALLRLAATARRRGELEEGWEWVSRAAIRAGAGDEAAVEALPDEEAAELLVERGLLALAEGRQEAAETDLRAAAHRARRPGMEIDVGLHRARAALGAGRSLEAGERAREVEAKAIRGGAFSRLPEVYRVLGEVAAARGIEEAYVFFERALEIGAARELPAFDRALTQDAYGRFLLAHRREEALRRFREAEAIFQDAGSGPELERVRGVLTHLRSAAQRRSGEG